MKGDIDRLAIGDQIDSAKTTEDGAGVTAVGGSARVVYHQVRLIALWRHTKFQVGHSQLYPLARRSLQWDRSVWKL